MSDRYLCIKKNLIFDPTPEKTDCDSLGAECGIYQGIATAKTVRTFLTAETIAITASSFFLLPSAISLDRRILLYFH